MICLADDVNTVSGYKNDTSGGMVFLFTLLTCGIYSWYWLYKCGDKLDQTRAANGRPTGSLSVLYLVLSIFGLGIVSYILMQSELNGYAQIQG